MKTIKIYSLLFFIIATTFSCNKDEVKEEKDPYIYAQQVYYATAVANKRDLLTRQEEIQEIISAGNSTEELELERETNSSQIIKLASLIEYFLGVTPSVGPIGPIPIPPGGCFDVANCIPKQNLKDIKGMVLHDDIKITYVAILDSEVGDIVDSFIPGADMFVPGDMFIPGDEFNDQDVWLLNRDVFTTNITKMYTTVSVEGIENVVLETPIAME